mmetsp:Transcript_45756/g.143134  ORF Transcript_45756/g.143134 Transcript_45756/m.143134 type:complete len:205 (+) Transcript_45756:450-1064(+)
MVVFTAICIANCVLPMPGTPQNSVTAEAATPPPSRRSRLRTNVMMGLRFFSNTCSDAAVCPSSDDCACAWDCPAALPAAAKTRLASSAAMPVRAPRSSALGTAAMSCTVRKPCCSKSRTEAGLSDASVFSGRDMMFSGSSRFNATACSASCPPPSPACGAGSVDPLATWTLARCAWTSALTPTSAWASTLQRGRGPLPPTLAVS